MHIFFSGIGGTAIGPLAMLAKQAGYTVSGSDKQSSQYIDYLISHGLENIYIGQSYEQIAEAHTNQPIDWFVYSSAVEIENPDSDELKYCAENNIKISKRDDLLNQIITDKNLKLIAVAGTHGKTTTTAMAIWLFKQLSIPLSYSVGAKISFGEMGQYTEGSEYFILEADEFDYNFLSFQPYLSIITGVDWDHHEQFLTREDYQSAFGTFLNQTKQKIVWHDDAQKLKLIESDNTLILNKNEDKLKLLTLLGRVNRENAWQVIQAVHNLTQVPIDELMVHMNKFPGVSRRFELISEGLYTDYAHTEEKIKGCLQTALEASENVVVVYEPLTDRRQHFIKDSYKNLFRGIKKLYWVPSYLARENPDQPVLSPQDLISYMSNQEIAIPSKLDEQLKQNIKQHIADGALVVCLSGGGGGSLDEWLRREFA